MAIGIRGIMATLKDRVHLFNSLSLPGQPLTMHMGTSYLVNDLWNEVKRLQALDQQRNNDPTIIRSFPMKDAFPTETIPPQWICMTCKTVIGPVVDDDEHKCKCEDPYLIDLWLVTAIEGRRHT